MTAELTSMKEKEKKYKNRLRESERTLVMVANEKDELSAAKDKHTKSISQLQAQLQEAESMKDALDQQLAEFAIVIFAQLQPKKVGPKLCQDLWGLPL